MFQRPVRWVRMVLEEMKNDKAVPPRRELETRRVNKLICLVSEPHIQPVTSTGTPT